MRKLLVVALVALIVCAGSAVRVTADDGNQGETAASAEGDDEPPPAP